MFIQNIKPIQNSDVKIDKKAPSKRLPKPKKQSTSPPPQAVLSNSDKQSPQLDGRRKVKLEKGKIPVEAVLDLHGMTKNDAFDALSGFIASGFHSQKRCILVVTGKGSRSSDGVGVLKSHLPIWISTPPLDQYVLDYAPAIQKHGGGGAFYVYLKRQK
jgi:DNA-nicking Smr family endonuclease